MTQQIQQIYYQDSGRLSLHISTRPAHPLLDSTSAVIIIIILKTFLPDRTVECDRRRVGEKKRGEGTGHELGRIQTQVPKYGTLAH